MHFGFWVGYFWNRDTLSILQDLRAVCCFSWDPLFTEKKGEPFLQLKLEVECLDAEAKKYILVILRQFFQAKNPLWNFWQKEASWLPNLCQRELELTMRPRKTTLKLTERTKSSRSDGISKLAYCSGWDALNVKLHTQILGKPIFISTCQTFFFVKF